MDPKKTSPYKFYQFWLNASDDDAQTYIKIFSTKGREEIESLIEEHTKAPHMRVLQHALADEVTTRVHSTKELNNAKSASQILFGKATEESLRGLDTDTFLSVFEGVPTFSISDSDLKEGIDIVNFLAQNTQVFSSNGEARRMVQGNGVSINKTKVDLEKTIGTDDLVSDRYILVQKGKKNYFLITVE